MKFCAKSLNFEQSSDCVVVGIYENTTLSTNAKKLDEATAHYLSDLLKTGDFKGKLAETLLVHTPNQPFTRLLLVGGGKKAPLNETQYKKIIKAVVQTLKSTTAQHIHLLLNDIEIKDRNEYWAVRFAIESISDTLYNYDEFKSTKAEPTQLAKFCFNSENLAETEKAIQHAQAVALGVKFAKNVANCPPNVCNPAYLAELAKELDSEYSQISTTIIDETQMEELKMNSYLAVSRGSENPAYMSIIEYKNAPNSDAKPIVLVGKGLTFDSGGISIKPSAAMDEMKYDMGGAASVYGTMKAVAELQLPINVIGVLAGCENMPDGNAYRPGDILTTMSGKTVEVLNTDAEGRLVLCDALTYVERFEPECVIDIATLTGACVVGLGHINTGLLSKDDQFVEQLLNASKQAHDYTWHLPMNEEYQDDLKSNFADLANVGSRAGGAITAGIFLSNFTENYTWAHLDIAGTAWQSGAAKGATGRPVPLLTQFLINKSS
ncbi:leucyl aminopeptidase [Pasteurella atlantica]|uniref:leucyl aminopeptidase n=1 Tax=Pasteurellaceae TaxID=712 RepID=UPI00274311D5|nr:leucyl aminopeptidase [Pasteurella atlantica]MDP8099048.1 leucyl aminopeptidase [Pasteurella atlantica]MDP8101367.1 leucyl aminopeptidase [Pasteurella atlantica]MDP8107075.1 leucyl aminopeptidase [Pasteurella atlantica]MDP8116765.1 leucyl aminopeptidase [Pasteurella atlantica]